MAHTHTHRTWRQPVGGFKDPRGSLRDEQKSNEHVSLKDFTNFWNFVLTQTGIDALEQIEAINAGVPKWNHSRRAWEKLLKHYKQYNPDSKYTPAPSLLIFLLAVSLKNPALDIHRRHIQWVLHLLWTLKVYKYDLEKEDIPKTCTPVENSAKWIPSLPTDIVEYAVNTKLDNVNVSPEIIQTYSQAADGDDQSGHSVDVDSTYAPASEEIAAATVKKHDQVQRKVSVIITPPTCIIVWFSMLKSWMDNLDLKYNHNHGLDIESSTKHFNDCFYVRNHNALDWDNFIILKNGSMFIPGCVVVDTDTHEYYYIDAINYKINANARLALQSGNQTTCGALCSKDWEAVASIDVRVLHRRSGDWYGDRVTSVDIEEDTPWMIYKLNPALIKIRVGNAQSWVCATLKPPQWQHPDVVQNKPFIFFLLGFDGWRSSQFSGTQSNEIKSLYWNVGNFTNDLAFRNCLTFGAAHSDNDVPVAELMSDLWLRFEVMFDEGALCLVNQQVQRIRGMVANISVDFKERPVFYRRRGFSRNSRSESKHYNGFMQGVLWPDNCIHTLLQYKHYVPGKYLLLTWQLIRQMYPTMPDKVGMGLSISTKHIDIYGETPIASTLKACSALHHTTSLGILKTCAGMVWLLAHQHSTYGTPAITICIMRDLLNQNFHIRNGLTCHLINNIGDIFRFNNIQQVWQKIMQFMFTWDDILGQSIHVTLFQWLCIWCLKLIQCESDSQTKELQTMYIKWAKLAQQHWGPWLNLLPKARILMDCLTEMYLFGNLKFMNDIHTEHAHQRNKKYWQKFNNHKLANNGVLTHKYNEFLSWMYALNGGKWGPRLSIGLSTDCLELKDPLKPHQCHPFLKPFRIPSVRQQTSPRVVVTQSKKLPVSWDWSLFGIGDQSMNELMDVITHYWFDEELNCWDDVNSLIGFECHQVKSWCLQDGLKSTLVNYERTGCKNAWIKIHQDIVEIMEVHACFVLECVGKCNIRIALGQTGVLTPAANPDKWMEDLHGTMDTVTWCNNVLTFRGLDFILETVMLQHKHIQFREVRGQLGQEWVNVTHHEWVRGFAKYRHALKQVVQNSHNQNLNGLLPCGPQYLCSEHSNLECISSDSQCKHSSVEWQCNQDAVRTFYIWDSEHGWIPGLLNITHNEPLSDANCRYV